MVGLFKANYHPRISLVAYVSKERDVGNMLVMSKHIGELPELQVVTMRVLAMVFGAGASERNLWAYNFVHSKKRNRLTLERANDSVYVFTNTRLGKRSRASESFAQWDKGLKMAEEEKDEVG